MKNKFIRLSACLLALFAALLCVLPASASDADGVQAVMDGVISHKLGQSGAATVQQWIDGALAEKAGISAEWYVIALSQSGEYDLSVYKTALLKYLDKNEVYSASSRQKYALALIAAGSTDVYIRNTLNDSIGEQGVVSWIFGLHLLNNGYSSDKYTLDEVKQKLLSLQLADGGWAVMGSAGDVDITAMAVQALSPYYDREQAVRSAVDRALALLSSLQQTDGDYKSYGVGNPESTAQVLVAVSSLGIDCLSDSRFVKNGNSLIDGIKKYRLSDGTFCHKLGGGYNETATAQAFYSMAAYIRMTQAKSGLFVLDARDPQGLEPAETQTSVPIATGETSSTGVDTPSESQISASTYSQTESGVPSVSSDSTEKTVSSETEADHTAAQDNNADTATESEEKTAEQPKKGGYKLWVSLAIACTAACVCAVLFFLKRRNIRNFAVVLAVTAAAICVVWLTNFQTADSYYGNADSAKENAIGSVTVTVRCDTIVGTGNSKFIPENGIILDVTEVDIGEDDTVYDVLVRVTAQNKLHLETDGSAYVKGINNIYEFDHGELSGWVYHVNGESPSVGCGEYSLEDGDKIEWLYTCEAGGDVE